MKLILVTILSANKLALVNAQPIKPVRRSLFLAPAGGVKMLFLGQRKSKP